MGCSQTKVFETKQFPTFKDGTNSLLSKYLTKEIWEQYKDKQDDVGFTFGMVINSGVVNQDSSSGVYAGSASTYTVFADLLDPVINDYHKFSTTDNHVSNMDVSKLEDLENLDADGKYIISTRIRVARNCDKYPLGTMMSKEQRIELENKVAEILKTFEGDLGGKYYALTSLPETDKKKLIEDHFLFKEGDRFLKACGSNRDWPHGRGIFHNENKTFLVWINEEDHLRIISMQPGGDIKEVFERLAKASAAIEEKFQFAHSDHLGYITTCPTNLGTGLRASVHVKLPKLSKDMEKFQAIADQFYVQIRGIHGEHSESEGGVFDISNKRRLGRGEVELVRDMYDGVKAMIEAEKSLEDPSPAK